MLFASDLPALLKSEPSVKIDLAEPTLSVLASIPCQPTASPDGTPPPPLRSIKRENEPTVGAPLPFRSTKLSTVVTKSGAGEAVKLETRDVEISSLGVEGADSLGERVKKRRRATAPSNKHIVG